MLRPPRKSRCGCAIRDGHLIKCDLTTIRAHGLPRPSTGRTREDQSKPPGAEATAGRRRSRSEADPHQHRARPRQAPVTRMGHHNCTRSLSCGSGPWPDSVSAEGTRLGRAIRDRCADGARTRSVTGAITHCEPVGAPSMLRGPTSSLLSGPIGPPQCLEISPRVPPSLAPDGIGAGPAA